jgi:hypothetical protein
MPGLTKGFRATALGHSAPAFGARARTARSSLPSTQRSGRFGDGIGRDCQILSVKEQHMKRTAVVSLAAALSVVACTTAPLSVGSAPISSNSDGGTGSASTWTGYLENYHFGSGSDQVRVVIDHMDANGSTGTVYFGAEPALPLPTDPSVGFPSSDFGGASFDSKERFLFSLANYVRASDRFTFDVSSEEVWKQWCSLQTSHLVVQGPPDGGSPTDTLTYYACLDRQNIEGTGGNGVDPGCGVGMKDGTWVPMDCGALYACDMICTCTQTGCGAPEDHGITFDLHVNGDSATGSIAGLPTTNLPSVTVYLTRAP